jgi:hypothetical protein
MRIRLIAALGTALALAGCSLTIDPASVKPPAVCVQQGCAAKACGDTDCGTLCSSGSGCQTTHSVLGIGIVEGAGTAAAGAGHKAQGNVVPGGGDAAAASGHAITQGTLSR